MPKKNKTVDVEKLNDWRNKHAGSISDNALADLASLIPLVDVRLGAWAMHPEHGKVLIVATKTYRDGGVLVAFPDERNATGAAYEWVPDTDLSPLPDTRDDSDSDQGSNCQGTLNSSPEPQPGEAWEVALDDEKFNAIVSGAGYLYVDTVRTWTPAHSVTPLRRLVPAQEPRVLTTEADYENAAQNTVVRRSDDAPAIEKVDIGTWWSTEGHSYHDDDMAGTSRTVLWEPEA